MRGAVQDGGPQGERPEDHAGSQRLTTIRRETRGASGVDRSDDEHATVRGGLRWSRRFPSAMRGTTREAWLVY